ncbi:MAG: cellulase family glycosylhydrolase [Oscillospiraceae bacterium]|nr:cellulase family glycosylhydrolase [Oscillospiraceae bacterium]MDY2848282.1 cellulase family glycosylhydrolase [Oscillospiraceae bacterium]
MNNFSGYKKGVNLGGWLSQCDHTYEHYDSFITEEDITTISSWKVDHVRLPIDYELLEDDNGNYIEKGFSYIDNAVKWCRNAGLNIIIDLHKTAGYSFDKGENENGFFESPLLWERFYRLWEKLAERYAVSDGTIAFELLNEVTEQSYGPIWNGIVRNCIGRIRKYAPDTVILVGGYWQNSPDAVPDLDAPYDDKIVYNFHCYDPMNFTHQGAYWYEGMDTAFRMSFDECEPPVTPEFFIERFSRAYDAAEKNGTVLYCGEYGVIENAKPEDAVKWFRAINAAFDRLDISRAVWSYKEMNFGISDDRMNSVRSELIRYL